MAVEVSGGNQAQDRPSGLRRGTRGRFKLLRFVTVATLAPTSVGILYYPEPAGAARDRSGGLRRARGTQAADGEKGAVDVVHAPAAVPASVVLLFGQEILHPTCNGGMGAVEAAAAERLETAPGDVRAGGVEHG